MIHLTHKEEAFARAIALDGKGPSAAYRATRDCSRMKPASIHSNAKKIMRRSHVKLRMEELRGEVVEGGDGLTPRQDAFALYYVENGCASKAYRRAYEVAPTTKPETVHVNASKLLANTKVAQRIARLREGLERRHAVTIDRLMMEYARLGFSNITDLLIFDEGGGVYLDLNKATRDATAAIARMSVDVVMSSAAAALEAAGVKPAAMGERKIKVPVLRFKIELHDKVGALDSMGRHLGLFDADYRQRGAAAEEAMAALEKREADLAKLAGSVARGLAAMWGVGDGGAPAGAAT